MMQQFGRFMGFHINKENWVLFLRLPLGPAEDFFLNIKILAEADFEEKILVCFEFIYSCGILQKKFFIIYLVLSFPVSSEISSII